MRPASHRPGGSAGRPGVVSSRIQESIGDHKGVGDGVQELRIDFGPGYRVYFAEHDATIVLLLCGGDKATQSSDIANAKAFWAHWKEKNDDQSEKQR
jgi:putative addiction module killer protein